MEEQTLFPLSWPLLDCVCHVPDHDQDHDVTMIVMVIGDIVLLHCVSIVLIHLFLTNVDGADGATADYLIRFSSSLILCLNSLDS